MRIRMVDPIKSLRTKRAMAFGKKPGRRKGDNRNVRRGKGIITNPLGIGGLKKGDPSRNPTGKGGLTKGTASTRAKVMKAILMRSGRLDKTQSGNYQKKERVKSVALEARELQELAKKSMPAAMERINEIITDRKSQDHHAIAATVFMADRAYGKALQPSLNAGADNNGNPSEIDDTELNKRISDALERVARITGGTSKKAKGKK